MACGAPVYEASREQWEGPTCVQPAPHGPACAPATPGVAPTRIDANASSPASAASRRCAPRRADGPPRRKRRPWCVPDDPNRVDRDVVPGRRRDEPDQGQLALVRKPKRDVLRMITVLPPVLVAQEAIWSFRVLVWRDLADGREARSNGQRGGKVSRLSDPALGIHEGNPSTLELELGEVVEPQDAAAAVDALVQPADRGRPEPLLVVLVDGNILSWRAFSPHNSVRRSSTPPGA